MNSQTFTNVRSMVAGLGKTVRRRGVAGAVLGAALLTISLMPHSASAAIFLCRTDPVVKLSDGTMIQLQAAVSDDPADVQQVAYTIHAPVGTSVIWVVYTGGSFNAKETVRFLADNDAGTFDTTTVVSTGARGIAVSVQTSIASVGSASASGQSGDRLTVHIADAQVAGTNASPAAAGRS